MPTAEQRVKDEIDRTESTNVDAADGHVAAAAGAPNLKARKQEHDKAADCYRQAALDLVALAEKREKKAANTAKAEPASEIWEEAAEIRKAAAQMRTEEAGQRPLGEHPAAGSATSRERAAENHHRAAYDLHKASEKNSEAAKSDKGAVAAREAAEAARQATAASAELDLAKADYSFAAADRRIVARGETDPNEKARWNQEADNDDSKATGITVNKITT